MQSRAIKPALVMPRPLRLWSALMRIIDHPSPNFGPRRGTDRPKLIVLHYTAMQTAQAACARLCDPAPEVSAHYLISETGDIFRLVPDEMRAWHAGAGAWREISDVNSHSIGIELANPGNTPFPEPQLSALEQLLEALFERWTFIPDAVLGHSDIAPGRKIDPGPKFPWARLAHAEFAAPTPRPIDTDVITLAAFHDAARAYGYTADAAPQEILTAFRLRFRPQALNAPLDDQDIGLAMALAAQRRTR